MIGLTKTIRRKQWQRTTNKIACRASSLIGDGQPNPDWIVARIKEEFSDASECQILTAVASETRKMIAAFGRTSAAIIDHSSDAAINDWSNVYHAHKNDEYIHLYWPLLRLARSIYYEEQMGLEYADYAENAARRVLKMWSDTFETGPSSLEKLQDEQSAVIRYTPIRIGTTIMAFKTLFRLNQEDKDFLEHLANGILHICVRYSLNEDETMQLLKSWDSFVAEQVC